MGAYSTALPGGVPIDEAEVSRFSKLWGFPVPDRAGLTTTDMIDSAHDGALDMMFSAGGNFLDVLPDPKHVYEALERIPLRVHMDIVLSSQMFVEPGEEVLLLPAKTRYEIEGGVTETSTERRIIFNPEIPGPRIGEARAEWEVFGGLAARVLPEIADKVRFPDTDSIRAEIAAAVPIYDGIQHLKKKGDSFQYGGPHLCADGHFSTSSGRAQFFPVMVEDRRPPDGKFMVTTRRGKQFNSMVHETTDSFNGAVREAVLINPGDAARLGVKNGDQVLLRNDLGELRCRVTEAPVQPGSLQVHWPEGQVLLDPSCRSPEAKIPDYNSAVEVIPERTPA
jgi:predicted molibdopterin-dependent oxidoreductase YjgC